MDSFSYIILATLFISLLSFAGGFLLFSKKLQSKQSISYLVSFAAGIMLATTFLELFPEALESETVPVFYAALIGIIISFSMERFVLFHHHHHEEHGSIKPSGFLILVGDGIHNFIDGVGIASAFLINPVVGITTTIAMAAHEIPQELADFSVLLFSGYSKKQALFFNFLSALTALVGAVLGYLFLSSLNHYVPLALGFTGGSFIYIACADLIPQLHDNSSSKHAWTQIVPFITGVILLQILTTLIGE